MPLVNIASGPLPLILDANGDPVSGALWYVTKAGTATEVATYTTLAGTTANAYPVVGASDGSVAGIFFEAQSVKIDVKTAAGVSLPGYPIDNVNYGGVGDTFSTRAAAIATSIDTGVNEIRTSSYAALGDHGGGTYLRVASEPSHNGKINSADGAWWELQPDSDGFNILAFGVDGTGATDSSTEFQNAVDAAIAKSKNLYCVKSSILAGGITITTTNADFMTLEMNNSTWTQVATGVPCVTVAGRQLTMRNVRLENYTSALTSTEVLIKQTSMFRGRFVNVSTGFDGRTGHWAIGSNGNGGNYWNNYQQCHTYWDLDPTVTGGYGSSASSINQNTWSSAQVLGLDITGPTLTPGNQQQFYGNTWHDCDVLRSVVNNYTAGIGPGTASNYAPKFVDCAYEPIEDDGANITGPIIFHGRRIATYSDVIPFDPDYPDRELEMDSSVGPGTAGNWVPDAMSVLRVDPSAGDIPEELTSDFNGTWAVTYNDSENAPSGIRYFTWTKTASGQGSPSITLPREVLRQAALVGGVTVAMWVKNVSGGLVAPIAGYKRPAASGSRTSVGISTKSVAGSAWQLRWTSLRIEQADLATTDTIELMLSEINNGISAEYRFGTIEVFLGRHARPPRLQQTDVYSNEVTLAANGSSTADVFTISMPLSRTVSYRGSLIMTDNAGEATATGASFDIVCSRGTSGNATATINTSIHPSSGSAVINSLTAVISTADVIIRVRLSTIAGTPDMKIKGFIRSDGSPNDLRIIT